MAMATLPRGTLKGGAWVYVDESKMGGKMVKSRYSMNELSSTVYTFKWEVMGEGGWQTIVEGKTTKR